MDTEKSDVLKDVLNTGHPGVTISVCQSGVAEKFTQLNQYQVIYGPTRTGMSVSPILPAVAELFRKTKR